MQPFKTELERTREKYLQSFKTELELSREKLIHEKFREHWDYGMLAKHLEQLASMFERTSADQHSELIAQFHDCAGKLTYVDDKDFGALVLESTADNVASHELRVWLYAQARFRATWCAQAGTSGGESISRFRHVQRLEEKANSMEPRMNTDGNR